MAWVLLGALVLAQIAYPLTEGGVRAGLTVVTVVLGYLLSVSHALLSRGWRAAAALVGTATLGGFAVEAVGVATGFPFGTYDYSGQLGPKLLGVPLIIPLAWTWMAWPAWVAAVPLGRGRAGYPDRQLPRLARLRRTADDRARRRGGKDSRQPGRDGRADHGALALDV